VPEVDSAFRNEDQDIPGGKDGRCRLSRNPGALTSGTPQGHVGLFQSYFTDSKGLVRLLVFTDYFSYFETQRVGRVMQYQKVNHWESLGTG
jgi:hypothetical protein